MKFEINYRPTTADKIRTFQTQYNILLASDYVEFLLRNNGGKAVKRRFDTKDDTITSSIMLFLPLDAEEDKNLESYFINYNLGGIVPKHLVPIGIDPADNLICISVDDKSRGDVYFCDIGYFEQDQGLKKEHILSIANSFSEFLDLLYIPE